MNTIQSINNNLYNINNSISKYINKYCDILSYRIVKIDINIVFSNINIYQCPICYDEYDINNCITTDCNHKYCQHCFKNIFYNKNIHKCSLCRNDIKTYKLDNNEHDITLYRDIRNYTPILNNGIPPSIRQHLQLHQQVLDGFGLTMDYEHMYIRLNIDFNFSLLRLDFVMFDMYNYRFTNWQRLFSQDTRTQILVSDLVDRNLNSDEIRSELDGQFLSDEYIDYIIQYYNI